MNISGHKFGMLRVVQFTEIINGRSMYECKCDCGNIVTVKSKYLLNGDTKSCGCLKAITAVQNGRKGITHGLSKHPLFRVWDSMKDRCLNHKCHAYPDYGGRGIKICEEWMDFQTFFNDVSPDYAKGLELDRSPDNNGNYSKDNFRWATQTQNMRNRRNTVNLTVNGITKPLGQWADETGISRHSIFWRMKKGKTGELALFGVRHFRKTA